MTKMKLCGISRVQDAETANDIMPDYVGFVFWSRSHRCIDIETAKLLRQTLRPDIMTVGVFVNEKADMIAKLYRDGLINMAQLHGNEDEDYIKSLRRMADIPIIKAFRIRSRADLDAAQCSTADYILLDAGMGDGVTFDWEWLKNFDRPYILAGGLDCQNVTEAINRLHPFGVDVSSGIETAGIEDKDKMLTFAAAVRAADKG
ncbi:MAG: phosphoribosylanthranilate isomerase [Spirochaetales bacterium]|nr:phosphoribosylanthranilate isomerase [Spirochaetales bacterium]